VRKEGRERERERKKGKNEEINKIRIKIYLGQYKHYVADQQRILCSCNYITGVEFSQP
jgi:predicted nucleic acid-binding Zn finger protein